MSRQSGTKPQSASFAIACMAGGVLLLVGLVILVAGRYLPRRAVVAPVIRGASGYKETPAPTVAPEVLHAAWVKVVQAEVARLGSDPTPGMATKAKEALLALRVAPEDKYAHLNLILALVAIEEGRPDGLERVHAAAQAVGK